MKSQYYLIKEGPTTQLQINANGLQNLVNEIEVVKIHKFFFIENNTTIYTNTCTISRFYVIRGTKHWVTTNKIMVDYPAVNINTVYKHIETFFTKYSKSKSFATNGPKIKHIAAMLLQGFPMTNGNIANNRIINLIPFFNHILCFYH